jgi:hypothetical protein
MIPMDLIDRYDPLRIDAKKTGDVIPVIGLLHAVVSAAKAVPA